MRTTRVVLAEDHHMVRAAVAALLSREADIEVIGQIGDATAILDVIGRLKPDVLILDAHMPGHKVIETTRLLKARYPQISLLILSAYRRREYIVGLLGAGANGYVLKDDPPEALIHGIRAVACGKRWLSEQVSDVLVQALGNQRDTTHTELTEREQEVLQLMARGIRNDQIAKELKISEQTVKNHIRSIFSKLGVTTRVEAVLYALDRGLGSDVL